VSTVPEQGRFGDGKGRLFRALLAGLVGCAGATGCQSLGWFEPKAPPPPAESLVLRGDGLVEEKPPAPGSVEEKLAGAHELFRRGEYDIAGDLYHSLRDKKTNPERVLVEATYYEAECLRLQARYPKAADTYSLLITTWPSNPYKEQAAQHLYEIANFWLEDTRTRMKETREKREKKRWWVTPQYFHMDKNKPFADEEGRAIQKLELVHLADIDNSLGLADRALFLAGAVHFFNENYKEAEHYLSQIHNAYPNSPLAQQSLELAIIAKTNSTGGAEYDSRKVAEARELVQAAFNNYPQLREHKEEFLSSKLLGINAQQAEKDYKIAEFYRRTGHPGSAWFYYELVVRRYPKTEHAKLALQKKEELRAKLEKEGKPVPTEMKDVPPPVEEPKPKLPVPVDVGPPPGPLPTLDGGKPLH